MPWQFLADFIVFDAENSLKDKNQDEKYILLIKLCC